jgi:hypothetical protein
MCGWCVQIGDTILKVDGEKVSDKRLSELVGNSLSSLSLSLSLSTYTHTRACTHTHTTGGAGRSFSLRLYTLLLLCTYCVCMFVCAHERVRVSVWRLQAFFYISSLHTMSKILENLTNPTYITDTLIRIGVEVFCKFMKNMPVQ